jgi:hypothetical protein
MINKIQEKYKCIFSSENSIYNNKYIQSSKFIFDNSFLIFNEKSIIKYDYLYNTSENLIESINSKNEFMENNYIYDYDIIYDNNIEKQYICLCSKDNPIRILNNDLYIVKCFSLENKKNEKYFSSTFIKFEEFGMNIFTGKNFLSKIDLISEKEIFIKLDKNYNYLSCFDYNINYSCYFLGSYNQNILICDYKTDKIVEICKQKNPINEIKLLNTKSYQMLVGYRNSDYFCLFDIRKMNQHINKFERNALSTKKINFVLDKNEYNIYSGDLNGNIIRYSFNRDINFSYVKENIGFNKCISSIDLQEKNNLLIITYEKNNLLDIEIDNLENLEAIKFKNESNFELYKI